jgi:carboxyl-terminal processing protease
MSARLRLVVAPLLAGLLLLPWAAAGPPADPDPAAKLIRQLGSESFEEREAAARALEDLGLDALPALRQALADDDPEVRRRARILFEGLEGRLREADQFADRLLAVLAVIEERSVAEPKGAELIVWAVEGLYEARRRTPARAVAASLARGKALSADERRALLSDVYLDLSRRPAPLADTLDQAVRAVLARLDPNAEWRPPVPAAAAAPSRPGVGLRLEADPDSRLPRVVTPLWDGPAWHAGVRSGDLLVAVTRRELPGVTPLAEPEMLSLGGLSPEEAERFLSGAPGSVIGLTVRRPGEKETRYFEVRRAAVRPETVFGLRRREDGSWDYRADAEGKRAYVRVAAFGRDTARDLAAVLARLDGDGTRGLVLDLRGCPGGLVAVTLDAAGLFLDGRAVLSVRPRGGGTAVFRADAGKASRLPLAVLVDQDTAGGAEVLAAALQDHRRAAVVGARSRGRGSARNALPVKEPGPKDRETRDAPRDPEAADRSKQDRELVLGAAVFLRPSGQKLDRLRLPGRPEDEWGVRPDQAVELTAEERRQLREHLDRLTFLRPPGRPYRPTFRDRQLERALQALD